MFDIGGIELFVIVVVAILVVGPRELPGLVRNIGKMIGQVRRMAGEFNRQMDQAVREVELEDVRDAARSVSSGANPVKQFESSIRSAINGDATGKSGSVADRAKSAAGAGAGGEAGTDDAFVGPTKPARGGAVGAMAAAAARPNQMPPDTSGYDAADAAEEAAFHREAAEFDAAEAAEAERPNGSVLERADKSWKAAREDETA